MVEISYMMKQYGIYFTLETELEERAGTSIPSISGILYCPPFHCNI